MPSLVFGKLHQPPSAGSYREVGAVVIRKRTWWRDRRGRDCGAVDHLLRAS